MNIKYESGCVYKIKMKILKDEIWEAVVVAKEIL